MSTYTPAKFVDRALPIQTTTIFTSTSAGILKEIIVSNNNSSIASVTITINALPLLPSVLLQPNSTTVVSMSKVLINGDVIAGYASTSGVGVFVSGVVIS